MTYLAEIVRKQTVNLLACYKCDMPIAMTERFEEGCRDKGWTFYCPAGHNQIFTKTTVTRLQEQLEAANARANRLAEESATAQKKLTAAKRESTRLAKRAAAGVCPCCNRTFQQLARHMKSKHPEGVK